MTLYGIKVQYEYLPPGEEDTAKTRYIPIPNANVRHNPAVCSQNLSRILNLNFARECTCQIDRTARTSTQTGLELGVAQINLSGDTGTHSHVFAITNVHIPHPDPLVVPEAFVANQEGQDTVELTFFHDDAAKYWLSVGA